MDKAQLTIASPNAATCLETSTKVRKAVFAHAGRSFLPATLISDYQQ